MAVPPGTPPAVAEQATGSLSGALSVAGHAQVDVARAQETFTAGLNAAALVAGAAVLAAAVLCVAALRHVRPLGEQADAPPP